jgi:hypothetical protein
MMTTAALLSFEVAGRLTYSLFSFIFVSSPLSLLFPICVAVSFILNLLLTIELCEETLGRFCFFVFWKSAVF